MWWKKRTFDLSTFLSSSKRSASYHAMSFQIFLRTVTGCSSFLACSSSDSQNRASFLSHPALLLLFFLFFRLILVFSLGRAKSIWVDPEDLVGDVLQRYEDSEGIPMDEVRLIFAGKQLDPFRSLRKT
jgi:hypothetical protein